MRHLFEQFVTAGEDWQQTAIMMNIRSRKKGTRHGQHVWKKFELLVTELLGYYLITRFVYPPSPKPENPKALNPAYYTC